MGTTTFRLASPWLPCFLPPPGMLPQFTPQCQESARLTLSYTPIKQWVRAEKALWIPSFRDEFAEKCAALGLVDIALSFRHFGPGIQPAVLADLQDRVRNHPASHCSHHYYSSADFPKTYGLYARRTGRQHGQSRQRAHHERRAQARDKHMLSAREEERLGAVWSALGGMNGYQNSSWSILRPRSTRVNSAGSGTS